MAFGLDFHRIDKRLFQGLSIARVSANNVAQINRMFLPQAKQEHTLGGDTYAITALTKVVAMRRNKSDVGIFMFAETEITGRPGGFLGRR